MTAAQPINPAIGRLGRGLNTLLPVILQPDDYDLWLKKPTEADLVRRFNAPCPDAMLCVYPVSRGGR